MQHGRNGEEWQVAKTFETRTHTSICSGEGMAGAKRREGIEKESFRSKQQGWSLQLTQDYLCVGTGSKPDDETAELPE